MSVRRMAAAGVAALGQGQAAADAHGPSQAAVEKTLEQLPAALTLDALHKKAMALERAGWGKKAAADRAAKATFKQWQAANHQAVADMGHLAGAGHSLQPCPVGAAGSSVRWASHEGDRGQSTIRLV